MYITKPESQKFKSTIIKKNHAFFRGHVNIAAYVRQGEYFTSQQAAILR